MSPLEIGGLTLFILVLLFGAFSILFGLPGTVIILIDAFLFAAVTGFEKIGFKILVTLLVLSVLAELADFAVGMAGAVKFGSSRAGFWAFLLGGRRHGLRRGHPDSRAVESCAPGRPDPDRRWRSPG